MSKLVKFATELIRLSNTLNQQQFDDFYDSYRDNYDSPQSIPGNDLPILHYDDTSDNYNLDDYDIEMKNKDVESVLSSLGIDIDEFKKMLYKHHFTLYDFTNGKIPRTTMEKISNEIFKNEYNDDALLEQDNFSFQENDDEFYPFIPDNQEINEICLGDDEIFSDEKDTKIDEDDFYQYLRNIQKQERTNGELTLVNETFYSDIHEYLDELKKEANDPFSNAPNTLKEVQIIATEIFERREHKITDAAVINIHNSLHLFDNRELINFVNPMPFNLTPGEKLLYINLIITLKKFREDFMTIQEIDVDSEMTKNNIKLSFPIDKLDK